MAVKGLGESGSDTAVAVLRSALNEEDSKLRGRAAYALGSIHSKTAVEALVPALTDEDSWVRWMATSALGTIASETAALVLEQALRDEDFRVRYTAAEALGRIGRPELLPALSSMLLSTVDTYELSTVLGAIALIQKRCGYYNNHIAAS
jgi:HEAT repeat protein